MSKPRRTQIERRQATIAKLLEATIDSLAQNGYSKTSVAEICKRAGVSQGGLFRHFDTRIDVIAATAEEIERRHTARFRDVVVSTGDGDTLRAIVEFVQQSARTPVHAAWHEVMVAARTDDQLRARVYEGVQRFEQGLLDVVRTHLGLDGEAASRVGVVILSVMHMFDSEAVTVAVHPNAEIEQQRVAWVCEMLARELNSLSAG